MSGRSRSGRALDDKIINKAKPGSKRAASKKKLHPTADRGAPRAGAGEGDSASVVLWDEVQAPDAPAGTKPSETDAIVIKEPESGAGAPN